MKNICQEKIYRMLGLCARARRLVSGDMLCEKAVKEKKAELIILAEDASKNTREKYMALCRKNAVEILEYGSLYKLGHSIGKGDRATIGLQDAGFAKKILQLAAEEGIFPLKHSTQLDLAAEPNEGERMKM
ncbi:MAG: ribosomal L7Ae/L30e/S12e/Gadd45 family protein [Firmicutes bacterium]|nr:ribosomal L7Ae/L30e/S12e/Gadd45 family protein [Bacillota bacterium]